MVANTIMQMAPISVAAFNQPNPMGPTAKISFAKIGRSAVAEAKKVLKK